MAAQRVSAYEAWFRSADKDGNGHLTSKELKKALKAKGYKIKRKALKEQFKQFDLDGDNKITLQEYLICMGQIPSACHKEAAMRAAFKRADRNGDGILDIGEINSIFMQNKQFLDPDELFKLVREIDKDGSGRINYKEFTTFFAKQSGMTSDSSSSDSDWD